MDSKGCSSLSQSDSRVSLTGDLHVERTFANCQLVYVDTDGISDVVLDEEYSFTGGMMYLGHEHS